MQWLIDSGLLSFFLPLFSLHPICYLFLFPFVFSFPHFVLHVWANTLISYLVKILINIAIGYMVHHTTYYTSFCSYSLSPTPAILRVENLEMPMLRKNGYLSTFRVVWMLQWFDLIPSHHISTSKHHSNIHSSILKFQHFHLIIT